MRPLLQIVAIHEDIFSSRVAMQITIKYQLTFTSKRSDYFLDVEDDRMHLLRRILVPTV